MKKILLFGVLYFLFTNISFTKAPMVLYTKDGNQYQLNEESKKENSILLSKYFKHNGKNIDISTIDSIVIGNAIYHAIQYKNNWYMARLLFSGYSEGYKIHFNGEKNIIINNSTKKEFILVTKKNKIGVYNYLFSDCFKKDSNLYKFKTNTNDDNITKEVTKKINCNNNKYIINKNPLKIDIYIAPIAGISLFKQNVKTELLGTPFNNDIVKPKIGYIVGGKIGFLINNRIDVSILVSYNAGTSNLNATVYNTFYTIKDTIIYNGKYVNRSIDFNIDIKYIILKSKISPTLSAGLYFSNKMKSYSNYNSISDNGTTYVNTTKDLAPKSFGLNIAAGVNYKPIKRLNVFLDVGYKVGIGLLGASAYKISEGTFYSTIGIGVKINK